MNCPNAYLQDPPRSIGSQAGMDGPLLLAMAFEKYGMWDRALEYCELCTSKDWTIGGSNHPHRHAMGHVVRARVFHAQGLQAESDAAFSDAFSFCRETCPSPLLEARVLAERISLLPGGAEKSAAQVEFDAAVGKTPSSAQEILSILRPDFEPVRMNFEPRIDSL